MKELIIALLAGGLGAILLLAGYRLARIIIPLWGLLAGFSLGASAASDAFSNNFMGSTMGIVIGLIVGLVFAVFAYFFFELAIVLLGANIGYWIGVSFISLFGIEKGFLTAIVGIMLGIIFGLITLFMNAPKYFLIIITSIAGAVSALTGVLLILDRIQLDNLSYATASQQINDSLVWGIVATALFVVGVVVQALSTKKFELEQWRALEDSSVKYTSK